MHCKLRSFQTNFTTYNMRLSIELICQSHNASCITACNPHPHCHDELCSRLNFQLPCVQVPDDSMLISPIYSGNQVSSLCKCNEMAMQNFDNYEKWPTSTRGLLWLAHWYMTLPSHSFIWRNHSASDGIFPR